MNRLLLPPSAILQTGFLKNLYRPGWAETDYDPDTVIVQPGDYGGDRHFYVLVKGTVTCHFKIDTDSYQLGILNHQSADREISEPGTLINWEWALYPSCLSTSSLANSIRSESEVFKIRPDEDYLPTFPYEMRAKTRVVLARVSGNLFRHLYQGR